MTFKALRALLISTASVVAIHAAANAQGATPTSDVPATANVSPRVATGDDGRGLETIVVTARRRAESLVRVPVAVTALSASDLQRNHATDLQKIAELAPQVVVQRAPTGNGAVFSIRGIGSSYLDSGIEQTVAVNLDNVQIGRGRIAAVGQFDLQQVEILKGPQALFFGKNSPAGVISVTSADPTNKLSGYVRAGYEFKAKEKYVEAAVSGPLTSTLSARIAGRFDKTEGWLHNNAKPQPNPLVPSLPLTGPSSGLSPESKSLAGRVTLLWKPTSKFSAKLKFTASHETGNGEDAQEEFYCVNGNQHLTLQNIFTGERYVDQQNNCKDDGTRALSRLPAEIASHYPGFPKNGRPHSRTDTRFGALTLNYEMGDVALTSVTGYTYLNNFASGLYDGTSFSSIASVSPEKSHTWSEEVRAASHYNGPLNFTVGAFYETSSRFNRYNALLAPQAGPDLATGRWDDFEDHYYNKGKTYSGFGQLRFTPIENLEVAAGVRYTHEIKSLRGSNTYLHYIIGPAFGLAPVGDTVRAKYKKSNWSPEATISYHPTQNSTIYAAYKTGYKSGGFANPATLSGTYVANPGLIGFGPEHAKGFELGAKGEFFGRTLRAELTVYRYTFNGLQLSVYDPIKVAYFVKNAGTARSTGVEGSINWRATPELTVRFDAAYNRAKYLSFPGAQCYPGQTAPQGCALSTGTQDRSGQTLPRAPKLALNTGFSYDREITSGLKVGVTGDAIYTSKYITIDNGNPLVNQPSFWRFNASLRLYDAADHWELALIGRNLNNQRYRITYNDKSFGLPGEVGGINARPREIVLQGEYRF